MTTQFLAFAYPGSLATRTGGYIYDARLLAELRQLGWQVNEIALPDCYPFPTPSELDQTIERLMAVGSDCPLVIDGLAFGAFGARAQALAGDRSLVALVHHPLALETGLTVRQAAALRLSERTALAVCAQVIVTSPTTARTLALDYDVASERVITALPGQEPKPLAEPATSGPLQFLAVGTATQRKDFAQLLRALAPLDDRDWQLTIAGSLTRDPACGQALQEQLSGYAWRDRVELTGEIDQPALDQLYARTHVFVSSSRFEGYGMAMMDAIGFGLPVVAVRGGAVGDVLPAGAGLLVEPSKVDALTQALAAMLDDQAQRERMARAARAARASLPRWTDTARLVATALQAATALQKARRA